MKQIELTKNQFALVDDDDYDILMKYTWCVTRSTAKTFYARTVVNKKTQSMHRMILNITNSKIEVDHIDGNGLNNQKANLRVATRSQNMRNTKLRSSNTSGYKGVSFDSKRNKYKSKIVANYRQIFLGRFKTAEEAAKKYNEAAIQHFGEFAVLNNV